MNYQSRKVPVGSLIMGGGAPVLIQSMWDAPVKQITDELITSLNRLKRMGCDLMRFAIPDESSAEMIGSLAKISPIPLVADIHFDYRLALAILDYPIVKIRINPGNIGPEWKVREICAKALDKDIAIRIGSNGGSLSSKYRQMGMAQGMVVAALDQINILEKNHFEKIVVSLKSSDFHITEQANRLFITKRDYPLHLGVTEAGPIIPSLVKSTLGLSPLLKDGIGDTIRISISDTLDKEVMAARELLSALGLGRSQSVQIISCPRCGRTEFDTHGFSKAVLEELYALDKSVKIAIMGCPVNGPGEAKDADLGIAGSGDQVIIFKKGNIIRRERLCDGQKAFLEELSAL